MAENFDVLYRKYIGLSILSRVIHALLQEADAVNFPL